jgi:hypothetical protein
MFVSALCKYIVLQLCTRLVLFHDTIDAIKYMW